MRIREMPYPGWRENPTGATCGIPAADFDNESEDKLKRKIIVIVRDKRGDDEEIGSTAEEGTEKGGEEWCAIRAA
jgi:hypothetical protein